MEKRFGVMGKLDGYELDANDKEGASIIDSYRKANDMQDLMMLQNASGVSLDESTGGELHFDIDSRFWRC